MVMSKVNVFEVKAKLSEYLDRALNGERIVICRHNMPVAELRAVETARTEPRPMGPLPGRPVFDIPSSFFEPLTDEELDLWEGQDVGALPTSGTSRSGAGASKVAESKRGYRARAVRRAPKRRS
jgi:antitoxin (DNA-binding transcriptional repressor) of toxin-antitoxin stability system